MAYFPNGTSAIDFECFECDRCVHMPDDPMEGCPVWDIHFFHNYDQIQDGDRKNVIAEMLTWLIDDRKDLGAMCKMRIERLPDRCPNTLEMALEEPAP